MNRIGLTALALLSCLVLAPSNPAHASDPTWETYANVFFGYSIDYPASLLIPQGEAANHDGQVFLSKDGRASLMVYSQYNALYLTLDEEYAAAISKPGRSMTYTVLRNDWFVISGYEGDDIYYQKTILRNDIFYTFIIQYPESQNDTYSSLIQHLVDNFSIF